MIIDGAAHSLAIKFLAYHYNQHLESQLNSHKSWQITTGNLPGLYRLTLGDSGYQWWVIELLSGAEDIFHYFNSRLLLNACITTKYFITIMHGATTRIGSRSPVMMFARQI